MVSPIENDCLKLSIDGQVEPQLVPKLLLNVSVIELHNFIVSPPGDGGLMEAINADNIIILCYSTLRNISAPQLNIKTSQ